MHSDWEFAGLEKGEKVRTVEKLEEELIKMIQRIYFYPRTMANSPCCIETALWVSHRALALARGTEDDFQELYLELYRNAKANLGLYDKLKRKRPTANDEEAFEYILRKWKVLSQKMGIPIDGRSKRRV